MYTARKRCSSAFHPIDMDNNGKIETTIANYVYYDDNLSTSIPVILLTGLLTIWHSFHHGLASKKMIKSMVCPLCT